MASECFTSVNIKKYIYIKNQLMVDGVSIYF